MNDYADPPFFPSPPRSTPGPRKSRRTAVGLVLAGVVAGGVLAGTLGASAASSSPSTGTSGTTTTAPSAGQSKSSTPVRNDEKAVSATSSATLTQQALAKVPGATVYRVETDSGDAAFEVHLTKSDGTEATVKFDKNLKLTAVETGMGQGDRAPNGQRGDGDGDHRGGPGGGPEGGTAG